jgi:hypothetical protein
MAQSATLPIITAESGLSRYLDEIRRFPMLEPQEEYMLAKRWREQGDRVSAHKLVTSHLRLVAKIAMGYRGYGLPISEVISEGNVGLMQAVKRFEPEKVVAAAIWIASRTSQPHEADTTGRARKWKPIRCVDPDQAQRRKGASPLVQLQMRRMGRRLPGPGTARR